MVSTDLISFWIKSPYPHAPLGFGVTAYSLDDALRIIRAFDYGRYLPDDSKDVRVTTVISVADLDQSHVAAHMGPIAERGMWYPFVAVGVPGWAENRITNELALADGKWIADDDPESVEVTKPKKQ